MTEAPQSDGRPWLAMAIAPKDRVIEARSRDWGMGPGITAYRALWVPKVRAWVNYDNLAEQLEYLFDWRELTLESLALEAGSYPPGDDIG